MKFNNTILLFGLASLITCKSYGQKKTVLPMGKHQFEYISGHNAIETSDYRWLHTSKLSNGGVLINKLNDSTVSTTYQSGLKTSKPIFFEKIKGVIQTADGKPVATHYLDFIFDGIYRLRRSGPQEPYQVLYYSQKRNSLLWQTHYGLNNITDLNLYSPTSKTANPFPNYKAFFKMTDIRNNDNIEVDTTVSTSASGSGEISIDISVPSSSSNSFSTVDTAMSSPTIEIEKPIPILPSQKKNLKPVKKTNRKTK